MSAIELLIDKLKNEILQAELEEKLTRKRRDTLSELLWDVEDVKAKQDKESEAKG
ncbi:MAG: hypothetical protein WC776_05450 [Patescibacteria group bacterium]|jgi:hypothetical protein